MSYARRLIEDFTDRSHLWTEDVASDISKITMYRGARSGSATSLSGPSFFTSSETFAKTYGPTASFKLKLKNPKVVSNADWMMTYGGGSDWDSAAAELEADGFDSAVNTRDTPAGKMYTVFLVEPSRAKLIK